MICHRAKNVYYSQGSNPWQKDLPFTKVLRLMPIFRSIWQCLSITILWHLFFTICIQIRLEKFHNSLYISQKNSEKSETFWIACSPRSSPMLMYDEWGLTHVLLHLQIYGKFLLFTKKWAGNRTSPKCYKCPKKHIGPTIWFHSIKFKLFESIFINRFTDLFLLFSEMTVLGNQNKAREEKSLKVEF